MLSVFGTSSATGGPDRYSEIALNVLTASTIAQTILFAIAIFGAIWMFRQEEWEFDLVIFWLMMLSILLIIGLTTNSADTQPQRFYAYLVLFGFNICAAACLYLFDDHAVFVWSSYTIHGGRVLVVVLVTSLALTSLASPVASEVMSPVAGDLPHNQKFVTEQQVAGDLWSERYTSSGIYIAPGSSQKPPIQRTGQNTGTVNITDVKRGTIITYSRLSNRTDFVASNSLILGGRILIFIKSPGKPIDNQMYSNVETISFQLYHNSTTHTK